MGYQAPAFMVLHPASELAIAKVTARPNVTAFSDDSKRALIDSRQGELASFTATGADAGVEFSYVDTSIPRVNRAVIPAGHNLDGFSLDIISDDDGPTFPSAFVRSSGTVSGSGVIDRGFSIITTDEDWLFQLPGSAAETFTLGEFWLGERKALTTNDGRVAQGFVRTFEHAVSEEEFGGRTASLETAPSRRKFSLLIRDLDPTAADFATLEEVILQGRAKPFWYWTPDSTDTGPYLVKLTGAAGRVQTSDIPKTFMRYEVQLEMLEQVT